MTLTLQHAGYVLYRALVVYLSYKGINPLYYTICYTATDSNNDVLVHRTTYYYTILLPTICSCCTIVNITPVQLSLYVCIQLKNDLPRDATAYMHRTIPNEHVDLAGGHYFVS